MLQKEKEKVVTHLFIHKLHPDGALEGCRWEEGQLSVAILHRQSQGHRQGELLVTVLVL